MHSSPHLALKQPNEIKFIRFWYVAIIVACAPLLSPPLWVRQRNNCAPITANPCGLWLTLLWSNMKLKDKRTNVIYRFITSENENCHPLWLAANSSRIKCETIKQENACKQKLYNKWKWNMTIPCGLRLILLQSNMKTCMTIENLSAFKYWS